MSGHDKISLNKKLAATLLLLPLLLAGLTLGLAIPNPTPVLAQATVEAPGTKAPLQKGLKGLTDDKSYADTFAKNAGIDTGTASLETIIGTIIRSLLGLLGTVFVVFIIYAGYLWMTAQGDSDQIGKAKKIILNASVGLVIILLAWSITEFVLVNIVARSLAR
ncbi:MAG: pilin [Patescibacteria group bacterium]|jgi:hypothetical protein